MWLLWVSMQNEQNWMCELYYVATFNIVTLTSVGLQLAHDVL